MELARMPARIHTDWPMFIAILVILAFGLVMVFQRLEHVAAHAETGPDVAARKGLGLS